MKHYTEIYEQIVDCIKQQDIAKATGIFMEKISPNIAKRSNGDGTYSIHKDIYDHIIEIALLGKAEKVDDVYAQACLLMISEAVCNTTPNPDPEVFITKAREEQGKRILNQITPLNPQMN